MTAPMSLAASRYRVAVIGGGPSGFYAAEALLRSGQQVAVDMFERLPVPYGLVRFGVAPDHPKLKLVTRVFDRIAAMPGFRFFGGIDIGGAMSIDALRSCYHAVVLATGASVSQQMAIPGEGLEGSYRAADFVAWYNGHPDFGHCTFDLSGERAIIIGHGNVALDVARILAKTADELRQTDIAAHALEALAESRIRDIHIIGRRGPDQTRFAAKELEEFLEFADCDPAVEMEDVPGGRDPEANAALAVLRTFATRAVTKRKRCLFRFDLAPVRIEGDGHVQQMLLARAGEGTVAVDCDLVFSSIGRRSAPIDGIPYDEARGVHANEGGRLVTNGSPVRGLYVCGWGKRGPIGTIGTNRGCSVETVEHVLADLPQLDNPTHDPDSLFQGRAGSIRRFIDYPGWERIDAAEVARGAGHGKPREKFVACEEMFAAAGGGVAC